MLSTNKVVVVVVAAVVVAVVYLHTCSPFRQYCQVGLERGRMGHIILLNWQVHLYVVSM